ncbi:hypothetical protein ACFQLX_15725 [Streptomyces polyrhachis]|uniref:Mycothiol-dependent maleylpyruvate isomerase metal-binding domain-containing protein n=1 Tax=Streptomyces polyrhachis TaxID=1282885 RepID=A0ABW2GFV7_9ACTN
MSSKIDYADALDRAVSLALKALREAPDDAEAWGVPAAGLEWTCWETAEHLADDLFFYAAAFAPRRPDLERHTPIAYTRARPQAPYNSIFADPERGVAGLLYVLEVCGAVQVSLTRTASPEARGHHGFGVSDPDGFAAMGIVETLLHTYDITAALTTAWTPPDELCVLALDRLFPDVPREHAPWPTLLWATGRGELPGLERRGTWRWYGEVRDAG